MDDLDEGILKTELDDITKKIDGIIKEVDRYEAEVSKDTEEPDHSPAR